MSRVICIAGGDSSGGAGLAVDRQTLAVLGIKPQLISSAETQQGKAGLIDVKPTDPRQLQLQIRKALGKGGGAVVKLGMLPDAQAIKTVGKELLANRRQVAAVVADPVMGPSAGGSWAGEKWLAAYRKYLPAVVTVLTPNLAEAQALAAASCRASAPSCAARLEELGFANVVITGGDNTLAGHLRHCLDLVSLEGQKPCWLAGRRQRASCRGSGCTHASALAAALARGASVRDAVVRAQMQMAARLAAQGAHVQPSMLHAPMLLSPSQLRGEPGVAARRLRRPPGVCPLVATAAELERLCQAQVGPWHSVQLRLKDASPAKVRLQLAACAKLARVHQLDLYVNDHWRAACALKKDHRAIAGVHLGQEDLASANLATIKRAGLALGVSAHNLAETCVALAAQPSYISFGPVFATSSKRLPHAPLGLARLAKLCHGLPLPMVAIGGITAARAAALARLELDGIAAIQAARTPAALARLVAAWEGAKKGTSRS